LVLKFGLGARGARPSEGEYQIVLAMIAPDR